MLYSLDKVYRVIEYYGSRHASSTKPIYDTGKGDQRVALPWGSSYLTVGVQCLTTALFFLLITEMSVPPESDPMVQTALNPPSKGVVQQQESTESSAASETEATPQNLDEPHENSLAEKANQLRERLNAGDSLSSIDAILQDPHMVEAAVYHDEHSDLPLRIPMSRFDKQICELLITKTQARFDDIDRNGRLLIDVLKSKKSGSLDFLSWVLGHVNVYAGVDLDDEASNDEKRYWLNLARHRLPLNEDFLKKIGVPTLPRLEFALVGQSYAKRQIIKHVSAMLAQPADAGTQISSVYILAGPPGHGKTSIGEKLAREITSDPKNDFLLLSCGNTPSSFELFGGSGAYQGAKQGSTLNNFIVAHDQKFGVVVLDEFDKLEDESYDGFYTAFDKGKWIDKKLVEGKDQTRFVDCSKIIWLLTTNAFDGDVKEFYNNNRVLFGDLDCHRKLAQELHTTFEPRLKRQFGEALARRLDGLIPFVPFERPECQVLVRKKLDDLALVYAKPEQPDRLIADFKLSFEDNIIQELAEKYDPDAGFSSLEKVIRREIQDPIMKELSEKGSLKGHHFHFSFSGDSIQVTRS